VSFAPRSLRARLLILMLVAVVPALAAVLGAGLDERRQATDRAEAEALRSAQLVSAQFERIVESTHAILVGFAVVPYVRYRNPSGCSSFAANLRQTNPAYTLFAATTADGIAFCNSYPLEGIVTAEDRPYFQNAVASRSFAGGDFQISRVTGKPTINYAYPAVNDSGEVQAVVIAALDVDSLRQVLAGFDLPDGSVLTIIESGGRVLMTQPADASFSAGAPPRDTLSAMTGGRDQGYGEYIASDGDRQIIGFSTVSGFSSSDTVYVVVGVPADAARVQSNARLAGTLIVVTLSAIFALLIAWFGVEAFLLRQIRALLVVARQVRSGDLAARTGAADDPSEFGILASAFDEMASTLQERQLEVERTAAALRERERQYRLLFESASDAMFLVDCETGRILDANGVAVWLYGYTHQELLGMRNVDLSREPDKTRQATVGGERFIPLRFHRRRDGSVMAVEVTASIVSLDDRRVQICSVRDVTDRLQIDQTLRESETRNRLLFSEMVSGFGLHEIICDDSGRAVDYRFLDINPAFEKMTGLRREDVIGHTAREVLPGIESTWIQRYGQVAMHGGTASFTDYTASIARAFEVNAYSPQPGQFAVTFNDVTERLRAERAIQRRNQDLQALHEIAQILAGERDLARTIDVIVDITAQTVGADFGWVHLTRATASESGLLPESSTSSGLEVDEGAATLVLAGRTGLDDQVAQAASEVAVSDADSDYAAASQEAVQAAFAGENEAGAAPPGPETRTTGVSLRGRDGTLGALGLGRTSNWAFTAEERPFLLAVAHHLGLALDNARLARQATQVEVLQQMDRLRSEFIANISHELRTPLGIVLFLATTLQRQGIELPEETRAELLDSIEQEARRLQRLVDNLVDVSHLQSGRLPLDRVEVDLRDVLVETVERLRSHLADRRLVIDLPSEPVLANIDVARIVQVLRNLIVNAAHYTRPGGEITIRTRGAEGTSTVTVSDDGIGIASENHERIFERFYRVKGEPSQSVAGVGLGLAICRSIVEAHGGRIWVESAPGMGSTFAFTLIPAPPSEPVTGETSDRAGSPPPEPLPNGTL
jgi:PAS domain S-box-containing protein